MAWLMAIIMLLTSVPSSVSASASGADSSQQIQETGLTESVAGSDADTEGETLTETIPQESSSEVESDTFSETAETVRRAAQSYTGKDEVLEIHFEKVQYSLPEGEKGEISGQNDVLDMSGLPIAALDGCVLSIYFQLHGGKVDGGILGGDTFDLSIPQTYFVVENTSGPVPVYNCSAADHNQSMEKLIGYYEIKNNVLTFTADADIENSDADDLMGVLKLKVSVKETALTPKDTTKVLINHDRSVILLPALPEADPVDTRNVSDTETETAGTEDIQESGEVNETVAETETEGETAADVETKNKEEIRSILGGVRIMSNAPAGAGGALKTSHTFTKAQLPEGFEEIKLTVYSKDGGYSTTDKGSNPTVTFGYDVFMEETVLYEMSEKIAADSTFPMEGSDTREWLVNVKNWLENNGSYPNIEYSYDVGDYFKNSGPDGQELQYDLMMEQYNLAVGSFGIKDGKIIVSMNPVCSFLDNVYFKFDIVAALDEDKLKEMPEEAVVKDDGALAFQSIGTAGGGGGAVEDPKYVIEKEAPVQVNGTTIDYTIRLNARESERLNGLTFKDAIPSGLEVLSAKIKINGGSESGGQDITLSSSSAKEGKYIFAAYDENKPASAITSAEISLTMGLDTDTYIEYMKNGINQTFKNKAALFGEDPSKPLAESEEVGTKMSARFIQKDGKVQNLDGTRYAWTIRVQTMLPYMDYGYLVDTISWIDHMYDFESGIQVTVDGISYTIPKENIVDVTGSLQGNPGVSGSLSWGKLSAETLHGISGVSDAFDINVPKAYYYMIEDDEANPFYDKTQPSDEPEKKQRAILIIPYKNLQGSAEEKNVTIKYSTELNLHGLAPQAYWELMTANNYSPAVNNKVNLLWKNIAGGVGPEPLLQESVNFGKDVAPKTGAVVKKGIRYDEKTQMLTWSIDVNKLGIPMTDVILSDILPESVYALGADFSVQWYKYDRNKQSQIDSGMYTVGNGCTVTGTGDARLLNIPLGSVAADEIYTLTFSVKVIDTSLLSQHLQSLSATNKVQISYTTEGKPQNYTVEAPMPLTNTLIEKEAVGAYDYHTHELTWKVTVNPNRLEITDAVVGDMLESGFTFGKVTGVEYDGQKAEERLAELQEQSEAANFNSAPQFILGNIDKPYTVYFTTVTSPDWRNNNLKKNTDGTPMTVTVPNTAWLTGKVGDKDITGPGGSGRAEDTANNVVTINPIGKSGVYHPDEGTIDWTLEINREQFDLSGLKLVENLLNPEGSSAEPNKTSIHELDVDTLRIVRLDTDENGNVTEVEATDAEVTVPADSLNPDGFTCEFQNINNGGNYNTYRIYFTTCLTGDALGQTISNRVYLKDGSGDDVNSSASSNGGYDGNFDLDKNSQATARPRVRLRKISTNSQGVASEDSLALDDAEFELDVCTFKYENGTLAIGDVVQKFSKTRSTVDGGIYFTNIKISKDSTSDKNDLICVFREINAAPGYENVDRPQFIYFATTDGNLVDQNLSTITYDNKIYGAVDLTDIYQYHNIDGDGNLEAANVVFKNEPVSTELTFTKYNADWASYEEKNGKADWGYKTAPEGVTFTITPINQYGKPSGKLETKTVVTDTSGKITISGLDAGEYIIEETKASQGMKPGKMKLIVVWNSKDNKYDYGYGDFAGGLSVKDDKLYNAINTTDVMFTKYAGYHQGTGDQIVSDNQEPLAGVKFQIVSAAPDEEIGVPKDKIDRTVTSGIDGKVTLSDLPVGNYEIYELYGSDAKEGYKTGGSNGKELVYTLAVTEKTDNVGLNQSLVSKLTPNRTGQSEKVDTENSCYNQPIEGTITFTKTVSESVLTAFNQMKLENAEFGLYRKIGNTVAETPLATQKSDANGIVTFTNVEYGDYVLKEISAPDGYNVMTSTITINRADLTVASDNTGFTYAKTSEPVTNTLYKTDIKLKKTDVEGIVMTNVAFDVYRRGAGEVLDSGSAVSPASTPMILDVPIATTTYFEYAPAGNGSLFTGSDGTLTLSGLPMGDYLLVENTVGLNLQSDKNKVAVHIRISRNAEGEYITVVKNTQNLSLNDGTISITEDTLADWTEMNPVSGTYTLVNYKKYGYVNLHKVLAEQIYSGNAVSGLDVKADHPVAGVVFEIYHKDASGKTETVPYLTLKTDARGKLAYETVGNNAGAYKDEVSGTYKHLWYGDYFIKETSAPEGFHIGLTEPIAFTIGEGGELAGHEGCAWISLDAPATPDGSLSGKVTYVAKGHAELETSVNNYPNIVYRNKLTLKKSDKEAPETMLSGAVFEVRTKIGGDLAETTVARLTESVSEKGTYQLTNADAAGNPYGKNNSSGIPYTEEIDGRWMLLPGEYSIVETKTPDGYVTPVQAKTTFSFSESGLTLGSENGLGASLKDGVLSIANTKTYVAVKKISGDASEAFVPGAALAIYEWDVQSKKIGKEVYAWTSTDSVQVLNGEIPEGTYVLKEDGRPDGYLLADSIYFTLSAGNKIELIKGPDDKVNGVLDGNTLSMTDIKFTGDITINKGFTDEGGSAIANVAFSLYDSHKTGDAALVTTQYTAADGSLTFNDIPEGSYIIKENLAESLKKGVADDVHIDENWQAEVQITTDDTQKQMVIKINGEKSDGQLLVENDRFAASLSMTKTDATDGTALPGVTFLLEKKDGADFKPYIQGNNDGRYVTTAAGLKIEGLTRGDYRLTETATIYGYELDGDAPFTAKFTVDNSKQGLELKITKTEAQKAETDASSWNLRVISGDGLLTDNGLTNIRTLGSVTLKKVDEGDGAGLNGVVYTLYQKKDGNWLDNVLNFITGKQYTSIADVDGSDLDKANVGEMTISGLEWGEYKLVEKTAQSGYILDTTEHTFEIGRINTEIILSVDKGSIENVQNEVTLEKRGADLLPGDDGDGNLLDGAVFTITNVNQADDTRTVTVTGGRITLTGLLTGGETYMLKEIKAPVGYALNPEILCFTMGTDGQITVDDEPLPGNILTVFDSPTRLIFTKTGLYNEACADETLSGIDANAAIPLAGVEFSAYAQNAPDKAVAVSVSDQTGTVIFEKLPPGRYLIRETKAPEGYRMDTNTYTADVISGEFEGLRNADGTLVKDNTLVNDVYRTDIRFTKVNEKDTNQVLAGSVYGLYKRGTSVQPVSAFLSRAGGLSGDNTSSENTLDVRQRRFMDCQSADNGEWQLIATSVTDTGGILEFKGVLMDTEYMIKELEAPDGSYVSANPMKMTFTMNDQGEVLMKDFDSGDGTVVTDPVTGEITWLEPPVEVSFIKQDENGAPLASAKLQILDADGNMIEQWTSTENAHISSGVLVIGNTYRLVETQAPAGYQLADPVEFTVENVPVAPGADKMIKVVMTDKKIDEPVKTPEKPVGNNGNGVKTGDETPVVPLLALCVVSLGTALYVRRRRKSA